MDTLRDTFPEHFHELPYNLVDAGKAFDESVAQLKALVAQQKSPVSSGETGQQDWHPLGDSNPCSQTENLMC